MTDVAVRDTLDPSLRTAAGVVGAVGVVWFSLGVWQPAWSRDEAATVMVVRRPFAQMWQSWSFDPALQPFYVVMDAWAVVSTSELWLRIPSVLAAAATAGLVVLVVGRMSGRLVGMLSGVLFLLLPAATRYGQEARPYALASLVVLAMIGYWLAVRERPGRRVWLLLPGVVVVGLLHAYALLVVGVLVLITLLDPVRRRRDELRSLLPVLACGVVALIPYLLLLVRGARGDPDPDPVTPMTLISALLRLGVGVLRPTGAPVLGLIVLMIAAAGVLLGWRAGGRPRTLVIAAAAWLGTWMIGLCALQLATGAPGLVGRYWTMALPGIALAAAPLLAWLVRRRIVLAVGVVALVGLVGLPTQMALRGTDGHGGQRWRVLPEVLAQPELAGAAVLIRGSTFRAAEANGLPLSRMPLVRDPAPTGRVLPQRLRGQAREKALRPYELVLVLPNPPNVSTAVPNDDAFAEFSDDLDAYRIPVVRCAYFGGPLAVYRRTAAPTGDRGADRIADRLETAGPAGSVSCEVADPR